MAELLCPKCHGAMRSYERNGVTIEQCGECRGVFLDRGELEHLMAAEAKAYSPAPQAHGASRYESRREPHEQPYKKRKKSFLSELFDD